MVSFANFLKKKKTFNTEHFLGASSTFFLFDKQVLHVELNQYIYVFLTADLSCKIRISEIPFYLINHLAKITESSLSIIFLQRVVLYCLVDINKHHKGHLFFLSTLKSNLTVNHPVGYLPGGNL